MIKLNEYTPVEPTPVDEPAKTPSHYVLRHFLKTDHIEGPDCPCDPYVAEVGGDYCVIHNTVAMVDPDAPLTPPCSPTP